MASASTTTSPNPSASKTASRSRPTAPVTASSLIGRGWRNSAPDRRGRGQGAGGSGDPFPANESQKPPDHRLGTTHARKRESGARSETPLPPARGPVGQQINVRAAVRLGGFLRQ